MYSMKHGHSKSATAVVRSVSVLLKMRFAKDVFCFGWSGVFVCFLDYGLLGCAMSHRGCLN